MERLFLNPVSVTTLYAGEQKRGAGDHHEDESGVLRFHRKLDGYRPTPLVSCPRTASALGAREVLIKDESKRLGLPAFKILGACWAVYRLVRERLGVFDRQWRNLEELRGLIDEDCVPLLVTATDGNHGRAVARAASWFGFGSRIFVPERTAAARISAIESEGAEVFTVRGDYSRAVEAARSSEGEGVWLVQDTAWPGYTRIPSWIVDGYSTIFKEIEDDLESRGIDWPGVFAVQIGVGSLASAAVRHLKPKGEEPGVFIVSAEPQDAACAFESAVSGRRVHVSGPHRSIMAGLNCPLLSSAAWPLIRRGVDAFVKVSDQSAEKAVRLLESDGVVSGESGAAAVAGILEIMDLKGDSSPVGEKLGIGSDFSLLAISTEGITDPELRRRSG